MNEHAHSYPGIDSMENRSRAYLGFSNLRSSVWIRNFVFFDKLSTQKNNPNLQSW